MEIIDIVASIFGITGSIILAIGKKEYVKYAYIFYWAGSACWIIFSLNIGLYSLLVVNITFIVVEIIGFFRWRDR